MSRKNPKVGFVSLGCPKALVDSERILTQLRVEATTSCRATARPMSSSSTPAVHRRGRAGIARRDRRGAAENGKVIVSAARRAPT
jgi:hypothetical protein